MLNTVLGIIKELGDPYAVRPGLGGMTAYPPGAMAAVCIMLEAQRTTYRTYVNHPGAFTTIIPLCFRSVPELHGTSFIADAGQHDQDAGSARFTSGAPFSSWPACVCTVFRCVTSISSWY